jgi:phospholipid-binding lipoprotein MlaA
VTLALALALTAAPESERAAPPFVVPALSVGALAASPLEDPPTTTELADPLADPATAPVGAPIVVDAKTPGDPYEKFNRGMFRRHQKFDRAILRPAALGYRHAVPKPARDGVRNIFSNLGEPLVFLNFLLQLKVGKAAETLVRFTVNSTLGFGGLLDLAKTPGIRLPHRPNGLGDTLGFYGVKPGPYLFLPFVGPTTVRDLLGGQAEGLVLPLAVGEPFDRLYYQVPRGVLTGLDRRAEADAELRALFDGAVDPYATLRSVYLQDRQGEIDALKGKGRRRVDTSELGEPLADPAGTGDKPSDAGELSDPLADPAATPAPRP